MALGVRRIGQMLLVGAASFSLFSPLFSQSSPPELIDRIVALVDEDPILLSDLDQAVGLGFVEGASDESEEVFRRRVLDRLIEKRLRFHEIDRFGFSEISLDEVNEGLAGIRQSFESEAAYKVRLEALGLDEDALRQLVARQIMVLTYVEERLGPRIFVSLDEIRSYYDATLAPEMRSRRQTVPPLEEVREQVRQVIREQRLNEEIDRWTEALRLDADIEDYLDSEIDEIPDHVIGRKQLDESN